MAAYSNRLLEPRHMRCCHGTFQMSFKRLGLLPPMLSGENPPDNAILPDIGHLGPLHDRPHSQTFVTRAGSPFLRSNPFAHRRRDLTNSSMRLIISI